MNKPVQCTSPPEHYPCDFVVICLPDEYWKYKDMGYLSVLVMKNHKLSTAIGAAEMLIEESAVNVIMDDINKFTLANKCHMERGAMMKPFLTSVKQSGAFLIMRTDERLESLDKMIDKIFS